MIDDELVVIEAVGLVPEAGAAERVDGVGDVDEVLEELRRDVLVGRLFGGEFERHGEHQQAVGSHPRGAVGLVQPAAVGQGVGAVEDTDVVEAEEAAAEDVASLDVLAVDPPGEVEQQLLEAAFEEEQVAVALRVGDLVNAPDRPGVDRRVDVGEVPLVGRELAVRVHVPFPQQHQQLVLGEGRIDRGEGDHVEGRVPGGEPRVLPLVGHRQDVAGEEVAPVGIAAAQAVLRRFRPVAIALEPVFDDVVVELLGPQKAGVALAADQVFLGREGLGDDVVVELVALGDPLGEGFVEAIEPLDPVALGDRVQAAADDDRGSGRDDELEMGGGLGAHR